MTQYDAKQAAEALGLDHSTVRAWANTFPVPGSRKGRKWFFNDQALEALRTIQRLKGEGRGYNTIRATVIPQDTPERNRGAYGSGATQFVAMEQVRQAVAESSDLAERYAKAAYKIGELENEVKHSQALIEALRSDKEALEAQLRALPSPGEHQAVKAKLEALEGEPTRSPWPRLLAWLTGK